MCVASVVDGGILGPVHRPLGVWKTFILLDGNGCYVDNCSQQASFPVALVVDACPPVRSAAAAAEELYGLGFGRLGEVDDLDPQVLGSDG